MKVELKESPALRAMTVDVFREVRRVRGRADLPLDRGDAPLLAQTATLVGEAYGLDLSDWDVALVVTEAWLR